MHRLLLTAAVSAVLAATPAALRAQDEPRAPVVLTLPASTRALALGNAFAGGQDPDGVFYNPAFVLGIRGFSASYERYADAGRLVGLSTTLGGRRGTLGLGAQTLDYRSPTADPGDVAAAADLFDSEPVESSSLAGTIAYARRLGAVGVGAGVKLLQRQLGGLRATGFAFDAGAALVRDWLALGVAVQNVGPDLEFDFDPVRLSLPVRARLDVAFGSFVAGPFDVVVPASVMVDEDGDATPGAGIELGYWSVANRILYLRAGVRDDPAGELGPFTFGLGLGDPAFSIDYAYDRIGGAGAHRIGLRWGGI